MGSRHGPARDRRRGWRTTAAAVLLGLSGIAMCVPGAWLILLGGSPYYSLAGILLLVCAWHAPRQKNPALWVYALLLAGSVAWSIAEVGLDGWALMPRLSFLTVGGLCLVFLIGRPRRSGARALLATIAVIAVGALALLARPSSAWEQQGVATAGPLRSLTAGGEWPSYGNARSDRFSPLAEITPATVGRLKAAWTYHTGLFAPGTRRRASLELTPLMVDGRVYGCTAFGSVFALDPVTGRQLWRTDPALGDVRGGHPVCRGVSFFRAPVGTVDCPTRLLFGRVDNRLVALDAATGYPCRSFGRNGEVDLLEGMGHFPQGWSHPTSPPAIVNGVAVIGAYVVDNQATDVPPGVIRGYDAVTGALRWAFDPDRPVDHAAPGPGRSYTPSSPNAWTVLSGDPRLNLVFVPMGNGSPDFFGARRTAGTEHFGAALVALDAATGDVRWSFQAVHHDLWDYDLAAQPALVEWPTGAATIPALIVPTKTGQLFVLDRRTGKPLIAVAERAAPRSTLPGERAAPSQPFAIGMPQFTGPDLTERDMWGLTPFDQLYCRIRFRRAIYSGIYTPMQLQPTIRQPGELGGIDWGSVSIDEARGLLIVNSNYLADLDQLITRAQADREHLVPKIDPRGHFAPGGAMAGTPYGVHWGPFLSGLGIPCQRPPYGMLSAVDVRTRRIVWARRLGDARNSGAFGLATHLPVTLGAPNIGGSLATGGGVIFVAATQDEMFRAIDAHTGRTLWQTRLPAAGHATPMSYRAADGHQYVVIAAGGQSLQDAAGDQLMAFRLDG